MAEVSKESTDDSSIRPVSSLRSLFENKLGAPTLQDGMSERTPRGPSPNAVVQIKKEEEQQPRSFGRASLDAPRDTAPNRWQARGQATTRSPLHLDAPRTNTAKARPSSMVSFTPPRSPPLLQVEPSSPAVADNLRLPMPSAASSYGRGPLTPAGTSPKSPNEYPFGRAKSPNPPAPPAPRGKRAVVGSEKVASHVATRDQVGRSVTSAASAAPPPVNRSAKPVVTGRVAPKTNGASLAPDAESKTSDEKLSPFSTPPSSEPSSTEDLTKSLAAHRGGRLQPPVPELRASRTPDGISEHRKSQSIHNSFPAHRGPKESKPMQASVFDTTLESDMPADRPGLPPRHEHSIRSLSPSRKGPSPPLRTSVDGLSRPPLSDLAPHFVPPPRRVPTTPIRQSLDETRHPARSLTTTSHSTSNLVVVPRTETPPCPQGCSHDPATFATSLPESAGSVTDYPDASNANRRPPCSKLGPSSIPAKYDTRLFDMCGEFVCTTGYLTKVHSLHTGNVVASIAHGEPGTTKVTSLTFKPVRNVENDGQLLWLGTNHGEILELDIKSQSIVASNSTAHSKRELVKIYRQAASIWTLDDEGKLHVWPPDPSGSPNLNKSTHLYKLPKGHSFSLALDGKLWLATGKEIRVFDGQRSFEAATRNPLSQASVGDVTSGATIPNQPDRVYFGHVDGKISVYSVRDFTCLGVFNISLYKINAIVGVGDYLWAGYKTGMLYVYDTRQTPWKVLKNWRAHEDPVSSVLVDRTSIWKLGRVQVVSLGMENVVKVWDGLLQDDWLERRMQQHDADYCVFREVTASVITWNAGAAKPNHLSYDRADTAAFRDLIAGGDPPDIWVFSLQELVDLEDKKVTAKSFFKSKKKDPSEQEHMSHQYRAWRDYLTRCLDEYLPACEQYVLLHTASLVGLFTCVFIKSSERLNVKHVCAAEVKRGMGGLHGNKGALIVRFMLDDSSLCFVNCHLAAGQTATVQRNNDVAEILETYALPAQRDVGTRSDLFVDGGDGSMILDHEICILNGDLNYRIDTVPRDRCIEAVKKGELGKLLERDQLNLSRRKNPAFRLRAFNESSITFAPTYKYDVGTDQYDSSEKKRSPAWCDRVLYRGAGRIKQVDYRRHEVKVSDHRPVSASFRLRIKRVDPVRRGVVWAEGEKEFEKAKETVAQEAK